MCGEQYFAAQISNLWAVSVLYGLYVALFGGSIYVLVYQKPNVYHLGASITLFLLSTAYMGIILAEVLAEPTITSSSVLVGGDTYLPCISGSPERLHESLIYDLLQILSSVIGLCISLVADAVLMYRCIVLWPHSLGHSIGLLLGVLLLAETALGGTISYFSAEIYSLERQMTPSQEQILPPRWIELSNMSDSLETAYNALSLALNVIATILIALRIWIMAHQLKKTLGSRAGMQYHAAIAMIVESGFAISVSQLVMVCMGNIDSVLVYGDIISNIGEMLLAIAPTLIIVRVGLGRGFDSVVETAHQHHASQGRREMQVKSIQFAEHRTTTTDASHFASLGAIAPGTRSGPDGNVHGADSSSERSAALGQAGSQKTEKVEVALDVV